MRIYHAFIALLLLAALLTANPAAGQEDDGTYPYPEATDPFTGDYAGRWSEEEDVDPEVAAQVYALGRDRYRVRMVAKLDMRCPPHLDIEVEAKDGVIEFREAGITGRIENGVFTGNRGRMKTFSMRKVTRLSPTLGAAPPEGAIVLFDGGNLDAWNNTEGWTILEGGVLEEDPTAGTLSSNQQFKDCVLHIEFRLPYMPRMRGQQRGNSGVFLQGTYEVQILDSYGLEGYNNECGALYKVAAPMVNACAPPLQWQTYDIEYRAPRYDADGNLVEVPTMTVLHNGVVIHNAQPMPWITGWKEKDRLAPAPADPGPIQLQAHNNYMQFRNIWIKPLD